jgi:hypothetical protein
VGTANALCSLENRQLRAWDTAPMRNREGTTIEARWVLTAVWRPGDDVWEL